MKSPLFAHYAAVSVTPLLSVTKILKQVPSLTSSPLLFDRIHTMTMIAMAEPDTTRTAWEELNSNSASYGPALLHFFSTCKLCFEFLVNTWLGIALSNYVTRFVQESSLANLQVPKPGTVSQKYQFLDKILDFFCEFVWAPTLNQDDILRVGLMINGENNISVLCWFTSGAPLYLLIFQQWSLAKCIPDYWNNVWFV